MSKVIVLIVGVTGNVGKNVVQQLLKQDNVEIRALVTTLSPTDEGKSKQLQSLKSQGVKLYQGNITEKDSLKEALQKVNAVVSAVRGGPEILFQGQFNLIDASVEAGVKLFIPAQYGSWEKPMAQYPEEGGFFSQKLSINQYARQKGLKCIDLNTGLFYDFVKQIFYDEQKKALVYYGDKNTKMLTTSLLDTGKFVSVIVSKPERWATLPDAIVTSGEQISFAELEKTLKDLGQNVPVIYGGSLEDIQQVYRENFQKDPQDFLRWIFPLLRYLQCSPKFQPNYDDNKYLPEVKIQSWKEFLQANPYPSN